MVIKQLKVRNIASVEEATIDFTSKPLNDAQLFMITGDAGKTILLDTICLALYGTTPALSDERHGMAVDQQYDAASFDPRHLMRRGSREAKVELTFLDDTECLCTATWSTGLCRDNTFRDVVHTLHTPSGVIENEQVRHYICETMGMDIDEFCRVVMLEHGMFSKFLRCREEERSIIFNQLMRTDKYANVGAMVAKMCNDKRDALRRQTLHIDAYAILSDDQRKEMKEEIKLMQTTIEQDDKKWHDADAKIQWMQDDTHLHDEENKVQARLAQIVDVRTSQRFQAEERFISEWRLTNEARVWYGELHKAMQQQQVVQLSLTEATARYDDLMSGYMALNEWIHNAGVALGQMQQEHTLDKNNINIYNNISAVQMQLDAIKLYKFDEQRLKQESNEIMIQLPQIKKDVDSASQQLKSTADDLQRQRQKVLNSSADYQSLHPETLAGEQQRLSLWLQRISLAERLLYQLDETVTRCDTVSEKLQECSKQISMLESQIFEQGHRVEESYTIVQEVKRLYDITRINVGNEARVLRAQLKVGDTCPVCGARIDKLLVEDELMRAFEPYKRNCEEKERLWNEARQVYGVLKHLYENRKNVELPCLQNELQELQQTLATLHQQAWQACRDLNIDIPEPTHAFAKLCLTTVFDQRQQCLHQQSDLVQRQANVSALQETLNQQENDLTQYTEIMGKVQNALNSAVLRLENAEAHRQLIDSQINKNAVLMEDTCKALNAVFGNGFWFAEWEKNPTEFTAIWVERTKSFNARQQELAYRESVLTTNMMVQEHVNKFIKDVQTLLPAWGRRQVAAPHPVEELDVQWASLAFDTANIAANDKELSQRIEQLQGQLRVFLSEHPEVNLDRLSGYSQQNFDNINALHEESDKQYIQCQGVLNAVRQHIAEHANLKPVDLQGGETIDYLQQFCNDLQRKRDNFNALCGKIQNRLDDDSENRKQVEREQRVAESLNNDFNKWKVLYNIVGTSNGESFRHIAQSYLLDGLLRGANEQLQTLNNRYRLSHVPDTLSLSLVDTYQPGVFTPVEQLGDAEVWMVSMALSLAMASGRSGTSVDTMLVDEGTVSLKPDEADRVMQMLQRVQTSQDKRLGIVSKADYLVKNIPVHVETVRRDANRSTVKVVEQKNKR